MVRRVGVESGGWPGGKNGQQLGHVGPFNPLWGIRLYLLGLTEDF